MKKKRKAIKQDSVNTIKKQLSSDKPIANVDTAITDFRTKLIKVNSKKSALRIRHSFYAKLSQYYKITSISTTVISPLLGTIGQEYSIDKDNFIELIVEQDEKAINNKKGYMNLGDSIIKKDATSGRIEDNSKNIN